MTKSPFDFTKVFQTIGKIFTRGLGLRIKQQQGIDGSGYSRPELSTLKARQRMLAGTRSWKGTTLGITTRGKVRKVQAVGAKGLTNVPIGRLLVSQDLANRGFTHKATKDGVTVMVSDKLHLQMGNQKRQKHSDIISWNSKGQDDLNPHIKRPPLVFPTTGEEVMMMKSEMDQAARLFELEATRQMEAAAKLHIKRTLRIA